MRGRRRAQPVPTDFGPDLPERRVVLMNRSDFLACVRPSAFSRWLRTE